MTRRTETAGKRCAAWLAGLLLSSASSAGAAVVADTETLGATADLTARLPAPQTFTVAAAAQVRITLADLAAPQSFAQLKLIVSRGGTKVTSLDSPGQQQFSATPGSYEVQVVGVPAGAAGTFDVEVRELTGNTVLKQFTDGVAALPAPPTAASGLDTSVQFTQAGTYQVTLSDRGFPAALSSLGLLLIPVAASGATGGMVTIAAPCTTACVQNLTVTAPGSYDLFVVATAADPDKAGLYSLRISGGPATAVVYATTQAVGLLAAPTDITLPATSGYTLSVADFATPAAMSALQLRMMQGADELAQLDVAAGSSIALSAAAGVAQLFVFARAASGGMSTYGIGLTQGVQNIYRDVRTLPAGFSTAVNAGGFSHAFTAPAAANYRLQMHDLNFPTALAQLRAVVVQNGSVVQAVSGSAIQADFPLTAGPAFLAVIASPSGVNANGLMNLSLLPQAGGTPLLDRTQGIGPLTATRAVSVAAAGAYDLSIRDLQFPAAFADLAVAVTRGSQLVGQIFGGGTIPLDAPAGEYSINLLARPDATAKYATWGFELAPSPPVPTLSLTASPESVGANSTTTITWSATDASSCAASGGWSGARAVSGTEVSTALAVATTFTLTCTGAGGSTSRSLTVAIAASGKGGGSLDPAALLLLAGLLFLRRRGARRTYAFLGN